MRLGIPGVDQDGIRLPSLDFPHERRSIQSAEMIQPRTLGDVAYELVRIAIEQRDIPFHFRAKTWVEHPVGGRLRPGIKNPQFNLGRRRQSPEHGRVVLYWMSTDDRQFTLQHGVEVLKAETTCLF